MIGLLLFALGGCGGSVPVESATPAHREGAETLHGRLVHEPLEPGVRSVEAYLGVEFFLEVEGGDRVDLRPTDAVPAEELAKLAGANVELTGVTREGTPPPPEAAAPLGMDGQPLLQGGGFQVASVKKR